MKLLLLLLPLFMFIRAETELADGQMVTLTEWVTRFETSTIFKIFSESVTKVVQVSGTISNFSTKTATATFTNLVTMTELVYTVATLISTHYQYVTDTVYEDAKY